VKMVNHFILKKLFSIAKNVKFVVIIDPSIHKVAGSLSYSASSIRDVLAYIMSIDQTLIDQESFPIIPVVSNCNMASGGFEAFYKELEDTLMNDLKYMGK